MRTDLRRAQKLQNVQPWVLLSSPYAVFSNPSFEFVLQAWIQGQGGYDSLAESGIRSREMWS
jgi:hypothetical protein